MRIFQEMIFLATLKLFQALVLCLCILSHSLNCQNQISKLKPSDGGAEDFFGNAVSINGKTVIVGARFEDTNGWGAGAAYIFRNIGNEWKEEQKIIGSEIDEMDFFGTCVDVSGDLAVVGAPNDRGTGTVYVYRRINSNWIEEKILQASDGYNGELFGNEVAVNSSSNMIVVGAPMDNLQVGSAYIFIYNGSDWIEAQNICANDCFAGDKFGFSISISEDGKVILVGDVGANSSGRAHAFIQDGEIWVRVSKLTPNQGTYADAFGASVSICKDITVVGSRYDDVDFLDSGSSHIYIRQGNNWIWKTKICAYDRHENQRFGYACIENGLILVGATHDNQNGLESGAAYIFKLQNDEWIQAAKILPEDGFAEDWFGSAVKISENIAVISSPYDNDNGINSGSVYLFDISDLTEVEQEFNSETNAYSLSQNFPNPFNPITKIKYSIPKNEFVRLVVFDVLGNEITKLVNEQKSAGKYEVEFIAKNIKPNLSSGVFFYSFKAGVYRQTNKFIYIK